jgi:DNA-binding cell septation regulator SpoVG
MHPINTKPGAANARLPKITVTNWKPYESGALKGFVSLIVSPGIVLHNCKLFDNGRNRWIGWPGERYKKRDGSDGFAPTVEFASRELEKSFQAAALAAMDRFREEGAYE